MLLLGIDLGTSSVKVSVVDAATQQLITSASYPETESAIISLHLGWAEQSPDQWWEDVKQAVLKCHSTGLYNATDIVAIGIAYQMHGLVLVDKDQHVLRNAIIWCDSRAVDIGNDAYNSLGRSYCLESLLNSPGNFTAAKLAWVKNNEPTIYDRIHKVLLPGDFIAMKLTGEIGTTVSALSEGVFWDFKENSISSPLMNYFGFDDAIIPTATLSFNIHGQLKDTVAASLSLKAGISISYKAGDQPNNALSLGVLEPGDVAATAGTSGVIYGVNDELCYDKESRINSFAHVNHAPNAKRIGVLLCINGTGIFNKWMKQLTGSGIPYSALNQTASAVQPGANGLLALPFGNGAERMLSNKIIGAHFSNIDFNVHGTGHMVRAVQEGIAFAFRYGLDIMRENGIYPSVIKANKTNLFLSEVFTEAFANVNEVGIEFYDGDGSYGAAIGAGIGAKIYKRASDAFGKRKLNTIIQPDEKIVSLYTELYESWKELLHHNMNA